MSQTSHPRPSQNVSAQDRRRIAVAAGCDPGCVVRYLDGASTLQSTTIDRIETALRNKGFESLVRPR
jgi:hypothetical protein